MYRVYLLTDPRNPQKGYVGQTGYAFSRRYRGHEKAARYGSQLPVHRWIRKLWREGVCPTGCVIHTCPSSNVADDRERELIRVCRQQYGMKLYNVTDGGAKGSRGPRLGAAISRAINTPEALARRAELSKQAWAGRTESDRQRWALAVRAGADSPESRRARSEKMRVNWSDGEYKRRVGAAIAQAYASPEARTRMADRAREVNARPDVKTRIDAARLASWENATPDAKERRLSGLRAAHTDPACRAANAARAKERWADPEYKARVSAKSAASNKGKRRTPVHHGSDREYKKGCRCQPCRDAHAAAARLRKAVSHRT